MGSIGPADFTGVNHARPIDLPFMGSITKYVLVISHILLVYSPDSNIVQICTMDPLYMGSNIDPRLMQPSLYYWLHFMP